MPFVNRFFLNQRGGATFTGNTLGLSRSEMVAVPGTVDSIGAFVTTNTALQFGTYPAGTTGNFLLDSSSAVLVLPPGATVTYAELIWGGTYINNGIDLSAFINNNVGFQTPLGTFSIAPDPATAQQVLLSNDPGSLPAFAYVRSAEVTALVASAGAGTYTASGIVGTIVIPDPTSNHAGWTLAVYYADPTAPLRNLSLRVGATVILATSGPVDTVITGFATPFSGALNGRALVGAQEGDANKTGDQMLFGPNAGSLTALFGPNNFVNNFFASQLNKDDGTLDTSGTFGTRNQINGQPGTNIIGGRQGWDITNVPISSTLLNAQTSAVFRLTTNGDGYLVDSIGLQIDIQEPILSVNKSADHIATIIGDIVTYTVAIKNVGMVNATAVIMFDTAIPGSVLVPGSVQLNGVQVPGGDPELGVPIGTIAPNTTVFVTFKVTVTSQPFPPFLKDQATAAFTFMPTPDAPPLSTFVPSNIVEIPVFNPLIEIEKAADRMSAMVGDTITYTLTVSNTGNINVLAVIIDPLPPGTSFISGTVYVDGVNQPGDNPNLGIDIGVLNIVQTVIITYQLLVTSVPPANLVTNKFTTDLTINLPDDRRILRQIISNIVNIPISSPELSVVKSANLPSVIIGETITYSVTVTNTTGGVLTGVTLTDTIPTGSSYVPGTVTVGGVPNPAASPITGIPIGVLGPNASIIVTFQLKSDFLTDPPTLTDLATVTFISGITPGTTWSNTVTIPEVAPGLELLKRANKQIANVGETVNYSVTVTNTGNITENAVVTDPINPFSTFVPGTVRINGTLLPSLSPVTGIPVGPVAAGDVVVVSYDVLVIAPPPTPFYENQASASFTYTPPGRPEQAGNSVSNIVLVQNPMFMLKVEKSVNDSFVLIGERVVYTIRVTNIGSTDSFNTVVADTASSGGEVVPGTLAVGGIPIAGDIRAGVNIGTVPAGATVLVTFQVLIVSDPPPSGAIFDFSTVNFNDGGVDRTAVSNVVGVQVTQPNVTATKRAREPFAFVGDIIHYETDVVNNGHFNALATWFDILPEGTSFVENSLVVNGQPVPGANKFLGTFLGTMIAGITNVVTFQLKVEFYPPSGVLMNQGNMLLEFILPDGQFVSDRIFTNRVFVPVLAPPTIVKSANVSEVFVGGTVTYTINVSNPGNTSFDNVLLRDAVPEGLQFVSGSLTVRGATVPGGNPAQGVPLGLIPAKTGTTVTFSALAVREPDNPVTVNSANLSFEYVAPDGRRIPGVAVSNPVTVIILEEEE